MSGALAQLASSAIDGTTRALALLIDDISMTPRITAGFPSKREGPIFRKVFLGSLRTKIIFLLPIGLILNALAPDAIRPLLGLGGMYLAYEGAETLLKRFAGYEPPEEISSTAEVESSPENCEKERVKTVTKTDIVLSSEIMAVSLSYLPKESLIIQALSLAITAFVTTLVVYGSGYLIVKSDDFGRRLKETGHQKIGRTILKFVPFLLVFLQWAGLYAMLWVAGNLMQEALEALGYDSLHNFITNFSESVGNAVGFGVSVFEDFAAGLVDASVALVVGLILVFTWSKILFPIIHKLRPQKS